MDIVVVLKMVPDVVEELEISPDGKTLDQDLLRMMLNESDEIALETALLLKEKHGGKVTVMALDAPEVDDALYAALAKGADRAVKLVGAAPGASTRKAAQLLGEALADGHGLLPADLVLTGTQANDDLDALLAPLLAYRLDWPCLSIVTTVTPEAAGKSALVIREYPGGVRGEFEVSLPAVLGIQSAEKPPRYVPVAKVRAVMKTRHIETIPLKTMTEGGDSMVEIVEIAKPAAAGRAEMFEGSPEEIAGKIVGVLAERGLL